MLAGWRAAEQREQCAPAGVCFEWLERQLARIGALDGESRHRDRAALA